MELCRPKSSENTSRQIVSDSHAVRFRAGFIANSNRGTGKEVSQLMTLTLNNQTKPEANRRKEILKMRTDINKTSFDVPTPEIKINLVLWGYLLKSVPLVNYAGYHFRGGGDESRSMDFKEEGTYSSRKTSILADYWLRGDSTLLTWQRKVDGQVSLE